MFLGKYFVLIKIQIPEMRNKRDLRMFFSIYVFGEFERGSHAIVVVKHSERTH
jgi:hypothetical protein